MDENGGGLCRCGCGQKTEIAPTTWRRRGWVRGAPKPLIPYHHLRGNQNGRRKGPEYVEEDRGYETPCWIWQGCINASGYGSVNIGGRSQLAYVAYHRRENPDPPPGFERDHLCRVRACVRPDHIEVVTRTINIRRGRVAKLTESDVMEIRRNGYSTPVIMARFGISRSQAKTIRRGDHWKGVA